MEASLAVPTATSVRAVPAKLLIDNRVVINNHLRRGRGGKVSFTHLIGYAMVQALREMPVMNRAYAEADGKPTVVEPEHINLGLAIDLTKDDGSHTLVVPAIKNADTLDFAKFWAAYEDVVRKVQDLYLSGHKDEAAAAIPTELIDKLTLIGSREKIRDGLEAWRESIVTTLLVAGDPSTLRATAELVLG